MIEVIDGLPDTGIVKLADVLEISIDRLVRGPQEQDQEMIRHFLDMGVCSDRIKRFFSEEMR